jgi:soluble lytic murein transglycosylase-like protein
MMRLRLFLPLILCAAVPVRADLVVLTDGAVLKVGSFEAEGDRAYLVFPTGGRMTLPIDRVERVIENEVEEPEPAPPQMAAAAPAAPPAIALAFEEASPVPAGPYGTLIYEKAKQHALNPRIVSALIHAESAGNPRALSHKGARGLMQLMPATAGRFGVKKSQLFDPVQNLEAGMRYLRWLADRFPDDLPRILAAYNAGEGAVERYGGIPPYRETRNYIRRIYTTLGLAVADLAL